ncbi:MAG: hypothetical protein HQL63_05845 [Magnetococcales bacterium]|nr:hypothetical protein [Magnetococcales bacterium]MBF0322011.1 hypothetical protein [Magnetococcales bacterium]
MSSASKPLTATEAATLLETIAPNMRDSLQEQTLALAKLFRSTGQAELPLPKVLYTVHQDLTDHKALEAFRNNVKKQINNHLKKLIPPAELHHPGDNRPIEAKTVWLVRELTEAEKIFGGVLY